ncbi:DUF4199 domain-containing protein [Ohtaekwangia sp.]|uniref:DUF4199 domain-containing protein n=1 Tax=Ohtaekwangia sp. TaxID=2066019 RepID=UPI002F9313C5
MMRSPLYKISFRYGLVAGVLSFVLLVALYYMGRHPFMIAPYLDFRILLFGIFIFFSLKEVRDYYQNGELYFWQGMIGGAIVVVLAGMLSAGGLIVFGALEPDFVASYVKKMTAYLQTFSKEDIARIGNEVFDRNLKALPATNIYKLAETYFAQGLAIGFFVSIILSVITRKQPKN